MNRKEAAFRLAVLETCTSSYKSKGALCGIRVGRSGKRRGYLVATDGIVIVVVKDSVTATGKAQLSAVTKQLLDRKGTMVGEVWYPRGRELDISNYPDVELLLTGLVPFTSMVLPMIDPEVYARATECTRVFLHRKHWFPTHYSLSPSGQSVGLHAVVTRDCLVGAMPLRHAGVPQYDDVVDDITGLLPWLKKEGR